MKRSLSLLLVLTCSMLYCKSFDNGIYSRKETFHRDVKPLRVIVNTASIERCLKVNDERNFDQNDFVGVIKNHLSNDAEPGNYHLSIIIRKAEAGNGVLGSIGFAINICTLSIPALLGMPYFSKYCIVEMEAAIISPGGRILKTYTVEGSDTEYMAIWWGYTPPDEFKTARMRALTNACRELRIQMKNDAANISKLVR